MTPIPSTSRTALRLLTGPASQQARLASFSLPSIGSFFRRGTTPSPTSSSTDSTPSSSTAAATGTAVDSGKGVFDLALESEEIIEHQQESTRRGKPTYHKSSTANFKTSRRKLNDLGRLIAGKGVDEGVLQLQVSQKKQASRLLSMLALARDHAIAKGLNRDRLVIAQSWTTQGPSLPRLDIKGRGRRGIKYHPSSKLHVLLAEGATKEEKRRERKLEQWRRSVRGVAELGGVGVGKGGKVRNVGLGGWKW